MLSKEKFPRLKLNDYIVSEMHPRSKTVRVTFVGERVKDELYVCCLLAKQSANAAPAAAR